MGNQAKPRKWEKVYLFISSTFNDMHAERDFLVKKVFPRLTEWCEQRRLRMVDIDLRWGVTEEQATRNKNVVEVCLNRIDECRPFFLCFVGQRYGWVPSREDISQETLESFPGLAHCIDGRHSVTDIEIFHALAPFHPADRWEQNQCRPTDHAFFYLRTDSYLKALPSTPDCLRRIYTDEAETDADQRCFLMSRLQQLRGELIPKSGRPVVEYQAKWSSREHSPELGIPLRCPAVLPENIERWRRQWRDLAGVPITGLDVAENPEAEARAQEFNKQLTWGRLTGFEADGRPLEEVIIDSLQKAIAARYPDHTEVTEESALQKELDQQEQFLFINSEGFIERKGDFDALD